ncbi:hypothetical protein K438DRAFT_1776092 [Mycena galopus ATCC 62051]|nr:hypothetical protein K438DRAFT_1776092 [Mycena galopus ATCC 62051]
MSSVALYQNPLVYCAPKVVPTFVTSLKSVKVHYSWCSDNLNVARILSQQVLFQPDHPFQRRRYVVESGVLDGSKEQRCQQEILGCAHQTHFIVLLPPIPYPRSGTFDTGEEILPSWRPALPPPRRRLRTKAVPNSGERPIAEMPKSQLNTYFYGK